MTHTPLVVGRVSRLLIRPVTNFENTGVQRSLKSHQSQEAHPDGFLANFGVDGAAGFDVGTLHKQHASKHGTMLVEGR